MSLFTNVLQDVRIGSRFLAKSPLFTVFATLILSIGVGANITVFSYANAILFKSLPVPDPSHLVKIYSAETAETVAGPFVSYSTYDAFRERSQAFKDLAAFRSGAAALVRLDNPKARPIDLAQPTLVAGALFREVGNSVIAGRGLEISDEPPGVPRVAVLNDLAHRQYFASDPGVIGRTVFLNNLPYTVVGIASRTFEEALAILPAAATPRVFVPFDSPAKTGSGSVSVVGRIRGELTRSEAQADLDRISAQLTVESKRTVKVSVERADQLPSYLLAAFASLAALCLVGVLTVLLIACDDIAIMLLARVAARRKEMGVRMALGASRRKLISQLITENVLLAVLGGAGAVIFALMMARLIDRFAVPLPEASRVQFDWHVLAFTIAISLATTLFFGLRPALDCVNKDVVAALTPGSTLSSGRPASIRSSLVITQITVCTAMLVTAALVVRSGLPVTLSDRGFKTDQVLLVSINFMGTGHTDDTKADFYRKLLEQLDATPGIESAGVAKSLPVQLPSRYGGFMTNDPVQRESGGVFRRVFMNTITPGQFATLRIPMIAGRDFNPHDDRQAPAVAIITRALAADLWPNESPIGQRLKLSDSSFVEVVGVAGDIRYRINTVEPTPVLYRPFAQWSNSKPEASAPTIPDVLMVRTTGAPMLAGTIVRDKIAELDANLLVYNIRPMNDEVDRALLPIRILTYIIGVPGVFTLLLGVIGTYGTMAVLVAQRRREIGIRIALGAEPAGATRLMIREGVLPASIGLALGLFGASIIALWLSRNIAGLNFFDPVGFVAMSLTIFTTVIVASYIPARRASRVDPMIVLREE